jgi:branched-chain amino acid transport system substrate-binding protein
VVRGGGISPHAPSPLYVLSYAHFGYDAAWAAIKAMQAANSTSPNGYRPKLKAISFEGITGHIEFNPDGSLTGASSTMYQVKNAQWVTIVTKGSSSTRSKGLGLPPTGSV